MVSWCDGEVWASKARVGEREGDESRTESKPKTLRTLRVLCVESKTCNSRFRVERKGREECAVVRDGGVVCVWCDGGCWSCSCNRAAR